MKKINIPVIFRTVLMVILIVLSIAMLLLIFRTWKYPGSVTEKTPLYSYSQKATVDYQAEYRPNILTGAATIGAGETYIAEYLNNILTSFNYEFKGERAAEYKGQYDVSATLVGWRKEQEKVVTIWKKEYELVPSTPFAGSDSSIKLSRELPLSLQPYNDFAEKFSEETKISSEIDLLVSWNVKLEAKTAQGIITETAAPTLVIPINKSYFNITGEQEKAKKGALEESITKVLPVDQKALYIYGIVLLLLLVVLVLLQRYTKGVRITDPFELRMKEIFKKHGERLVALGSEAALNGNMMLPVKTLEDLIKIADELSKPVMYKVDPNPENASVFYVFDEPKVYFFTLKIEPREKPLEKDTVSLLTTVGRGEGKGEEA